MRGVHQVIPTEREWLSVLTTINTSESTISNYYIFIGVMKLRHSTGVYEEGALVGMQKKG